MSPGMQSSLPRAAAKVIERASEVPSLEQIAHTTDTTYSAARFAPRDYDDLRAQAADAYDSGDLRKDFYPPKRKKEFRAGGKGFDWRDVRFTPEENVAWRHRAILRLVRIARLGAALGYLPEVSWENIYVFDGTTMVGCHFMKGSILALPSCVEWTDEEVLEKLKDGGERVIGYKMVVRRMLPSGNVQRTFVQCYLSEFAHLFEGENGKDVWLKYGPDMIYAACVRRAANHSFPDRVRGMGTKEEAAVMSRASVSAREAPLATPGIDALLEDAEGTPEPLPAVAHALAAETAQGVSVADKPGLSKEEYDTLLALLPKIGEGVTPEEITALRRRVDAFSGMQVGYNKLCVAFDANGNLNPAVVAS
jgi:hypothetical protein